MKFQFSILFGMIIGLGASLQAADPLQELKSFSGFSDIDVAQLAAGEIVTKQGDIMEFSRGITAQACFIAMAPPEKTARLYQTGEVFNNEELKIYSHRQIHVPASRSDFSLLNLEDPRFEWLLKQSLPARPEEIKLQMSMKEAVLMFECNKVGGGSGKNTTECWKDFLLARASMFQKGGFSATPYYETHDAYTTPLSELQNILKERSKTREHFASLIADSILAPPERASILKPYYYWDLVEIDGHPTFNLGAIFVKNLGSGHYHILDVDYYSSSGLYTSATFREVWPIQVDNKTVSLVWRGEEVSAPALAELRGVERSAAGMMMIQEIKKSVKDFQEEAVKAP